MNTHKSLSLNKFDSGCQQFIAFIDILGFRNLVLRSPDLDEFVEKYSNVFKPLQQEINTFGIKHILFSDSLFLVVQNRPLEEQLKSLVAFSKKLLQRSILAKLPIRGSISFGQILWDGEIVVGVPIIEAVENESMQDWLGINLAPSTINYCLNSSNLLEQLEHEGLIIRYQNIPVKEGLSTITGYVINFLDKEENYDEIVKSIELMKILSGSAIAEKKYRETEKFIDFIHKSKLDNRK
ncbi:hypothetical protein HXX01_02870 [Candidatus Nomurabacteria bacterium]|nr:hypothetical protein [Candidatus Nomurabacteria bacterium]